MSTVTRIGLALVAALATTLVIYYGVITGPSGAAVLDQLPLEPAPNPGPELGPNPGRKVDPEVAETAPLAAGELMAQRPAHIDAGEPDDGETALDADSVREARMAARRAVDRALAPVGLAPVGLAPVGLAPDASGAPDTGTAVPVVPVGPIGPIVMGEIVEGDANQPRPAWDTHTVRSGDTLASIAAQWFGDESRWDLIADVNEGADPDRLWIGQVLRLPPRDAERPVAATPAASTGAPGASGVPGERYTIASGDTLSSIAEKLYGRSALWTRLHEANRAVIGDDPARLSVGMVLVVPRPPA